mmetsp:Transcript_60722/g.108315  ORF Transcript_60722/g.108315 Transcript_60722/m.108315 type:complete len:277 (-) Transcript_60722:560-1390(-)
MLLCFLISMQIHGRFHIHNVGMVRLPVNSQKRQRSGEEACAQFICSMQLRKPTKEASNIGLLHSAWKVDAEPIHQSLRQWKHHFRRLCLGMAVLNGGMCQCKLGVYHQSTSEVVGTKFLITILQHLLGRGAVLDRSCLHIKIRADDCAHNLLFQTQVQFVIPPLLAAFLVLASPRSFSLLSDSGHERHLPWHVVQHAGVFALGASHPPRVVRTDTPGATTLKEAGWCHDASSLEGGLPKIKRTDVRKGQHVMLLDISDGAVLDGGPVHGAQTVGLT